MSASDRPPLGSAPRFLLWQASRQPATLLGGVAFGVLWMLCQVVWPYLLGRAIDEGIEHGVGAVLGWCAALAGVALAQAVFTTLRHRMAVSNWLRSSLGVSRLVGHHSADTGHAITATTSSGEIVSTVSNDALRIGEMFDVTARLSGSIIGYLAVGAIMLATSVPLGIAVLVGVPILAALLSLFIRPLQRRVTAWRREQGQLTTVGADTVAGLRVLRGIGGEEEFVARYARQSQAVRGAMVRVARLGSVLDGLQVLLPGIFVAGITWIGARLVLDGAITPGELVTFYGYAAFLLIPLRTTVEAAQAFTRGVVATGRLLAVLRIAPAVADPADPAAPPPAGADLVDVASGVVVEPGRFTAIVDADPDVSAAVATRLGRFDDRAHRDAPVLWGGVDHTRLPVRDIRRRIVVSDATPHLFTGRLADGLDVLPVREPDRAGTPTGQLRRIDAALEAALASETVEALPAGLDEPVEERGRSFSGGQRQRLSLARALLTDAEVLVLIEPTSAVDAHTEAQIADRMRRVRGGRTTVLVTASPLLLDRMDVVHVLRDGRVVGSGSHAELLRRDDEVGAHYRSVVARTTNAAEPRAGEDLDTAMTGAIDQLWQEAVQTGAIPASPPVDRDQEGDDDAAADR